MTTTDTPRTDAATELYGQSPFREVAVPVAFAEEIERELYRAIANLQRVIEITTEWCNEECSCYQCLALKAELDQIKATLNPTDK